MMHENKHETWLACEFDDKRRLKGRRGETHELLRVCLLKAYRVKVVKVQRRAAAPYFPRPISALWSGASFARSPQRNDIGSLFFDANVAFLRYACASKNMTVVLGLCIYMAVTTACFWVRKKRPLTPPEPAS